MIGTGAVDPAEDPVAARAALRGIDAPDLRWFVFGLFFIFGGVTSLNDVIIPKLKELFTLSYGQALLVQSAFFFAYFVFSIPGAAIVRKAGYPATASSRLTFAQAFNSLGTTLFPYAGAILILGSLAKVHAADLTGAALSAYRVAETRAVVHAYLGLAAALLVVAAVVWARRDRLHEAQDRTGSVLHAFTLLAQPRFAFGTLCIFLYVGAEVAIGSLIVSYLEQGSTLGLDPQSAGKHVPFYWGGALVGRFVGSGLLRLVSPGKVLAGAAAGAIALILVSANSTGWTAAWALLLVGLANSIMFPTIFSLASTGLGVRAAEGSGVLAMAIVGGAIIPPATGLLADHVGLQAALSLPAACYVVIAGFGLLARRLGGED